MKNEIIIEGTVITNPGRIVYPDSNVTKLDIVRYYEKVSKKMLPFLSKRLLSVIRCNKGIGASCFYKKHPLTDGSGKVTVSVKNSEGSESDYFYINSLAGLVSEVQLGTIEFHLWAGRADKLENPDMMVFDLDPDEGMPLEKVRQGVKDLKTILDALKLKSFLKTSGGKGYHVVVPFAATPGWDEFYAFAKQIAVVMESKYPKAYTSNSRKAQRIGKIFIDWMRNGRGATSIAPYSLRARTGAGVSMPIFWEDLDKFSPNGVQLNDTFTMIESYDPWKDFFKVRQTLSGK